MATDLTAFDLSDNAWLRSDLETRTVVASTVLKQVAYLERGRQGDPRADALLGLLQLAAQIEGALAQATGYPTTGLAKLLDLHCPCPKCTAARAQGQANVH